MRTSNITLEIRADRLDIWARSWGESDPED
jgi:hypothetical protein